MGKQVAGLLDPVEREAMRDHGRKIDPARGHHVHQTAHAFQNQSGLSKAAAHENSLYALGVIA